MWGCRSNKAVNVHVDESRHQELAIETIHNPTVARNDVAEILKMKIKNDLQKDVNNFQSP